MVAQWGYDRDSFRRLSVPKAGGSNLHSVVLFRKIFYEKEKFDDLFAHHRCIAYRYLFIEFVSMARRLVGKYV